MFFHAKVLLITTSFTPLRQQISTWIPNNVGNLKSPKQRCIIDPLEGVNLKSQNAHANRFTFTMELLLSSKSFLTSLNNRHHLLYIFQQDPWIASPFLFDPNVLAWCPLPPMSCNPTCTTSTTLSPSPSDVGCRGWFFKF